MIRHEHIREVVDLSDTTRNVIFNMSTEEAIEVVRRGDPAAIRGIDGQFALVAVDGNRVRMARSLSVPLRYFIAKRADGPALVAANRIDSIRTWLSDQGMSDQFHPSYTRMAPAHYVTEVHLLGCPDPNPVHRRFFSPQRESLPADLDVIGRAYVEAVAAEIEKWLVRIHDEAPVGVTFSGGIDSGCVFLLTYHAMLRSGMNPSRLKAFTLSVGKPGADLRQARDFLEQLDLGVFHEAIEVDASCLQLHDAVALMEDYKPLDVQAGAMGHALLRGVRERYPDWRFLLDGDGGDENLKDYPIEANPELTIRSVLHNPLLYHEGWGVDSVKHSLTYTGGLSRGSTRSFAPAAALGFSTFSPMMSPNVIEVSEGIPFIDLTDWDHERLYRLKGEIVARGVKAVTGMEMPLHEKRRFQHGVVDMEFLHRAFPDTEAAYRREYHAVFGV